MRYFWTEAERKKKHSSCCLEFQKGKFSGYWQNDSLILHDDLFIQFDLYPLFIKAIPQFEHWGNTEVNQNEWDNLLQLANQAGGKPKIIIDELKPWVEECFFTESVFTICGI